MHHLSNCKCAGDPISGVRRDCCHDRLFPVWLQHWSHQCT
uniref:Solute carrier family 2 (facilitated glucose transporter), member 3 n=1 Tax=Mus musculus TaxID=10090 RepID=E9PX20_MOUSE